MRHASVAALITAAAVVLLAAPAAAQAPDTGGWSPARTPWGHPDLQGIWDQTTGTPLERAADADDREFLTEEEAAERERRRFAAFDAAPRQGSPGNYGSQWRDGSRNALTRTSLIIDPPDGRIPPRTPAAERRSVENQARRRDYPADSWEDRNLWERCITRGTPRVPNNYNSNILILQTPDAVVLLNEMINETRVVSLDGRPHLGPGIRLWNGDSRGHWEGDTLVVQTTNFNARQQFRGLPVDGLRLVERFTRTGPDRMDYEMTLDDPAMYTRTWTVVLPMTETGGPIFEYACHEGNYGMEGILGRSPRRGTGASIGSRHARHVLPPEGPRALRGGRQEPSGAGGEVLRLVQRGVRGRRAVGAGEIADRPGGRARGAVSLLHRRL